MKKDGRPETTLPNAPFVDPTVAARNPAAAAYAKKMADRLGGDPRGGGPTPPIPPLNMPHVAGMTMADQAAAQRAPAAPPPGPSIFSSEQATTVAQAMNTGLLTTDVLPEQARQDPQFREGHGSMYAINQPHLAKKYGVIRNGAHVAPQQLSTGKPGLSQKTVEGLAAVQQFQSQRKDEASGDAAAERAAQAGVAGMGSTAQLAGGDSKPVGEAEKTAAQEALKNMDDFDFNSFRELMMKDLLNNDEQRTIVEERLKPLDISELIMNGRISQKIPVRPGLYEPTLQSVTGEEELALKRLVMEEKKIIDTPDRYLLDKFQLMTIACVLYALNNNVLPSHYGDDGRFDDAKFWAKFNKVVKLPFHMLASVGVHYYWFDIRVRKLFVAERIKNG